MKRLSDYEGEEAIELWSDLLDPLSNILTDKKVQKVVQNKKNPPIVMAKAILKNHSKDAAAILLRIDPEPLNGINIVMRLVEILAEIGQQPELRAFFGYAVQVKTADESSGSAMENTEENEI